jgi:hypothetical protein
MFWSDKMISKEELQKAKDQIRTFCEQYQTKDGFLGAGVSICEDELYIQAYVLNGECVDIPKKYNGYDVVVEYSGPIMLV